MRDVISGVVLLAIAAVAAWQGSSLTVGTPRHMGPGMVPLVLAACIGLIGLLLVALGLRDRAAFRDRWPLRGPLFIMGAAAAFGLAVRPMGLIVAGPLLIVVAGFASSETRWGEVIAFAIGMTVFCVVLFKYLLSLPIPLAPWLIGY
ncbi:MAG: tripartite tricarboxylate transporter TctB family protein [Candidatus Methylomirabilales bacterium]